MIQGSPASSKTFYAAVVLRDLAAAIFLSLNSPMKNLRLGVFMRGSFSPETRIANGLRVLNCAADSFVKIATEAGVKVARGTFSEIMADKNNRDFENSLAERLLGVMEEMRTLQEDAGVLPVDWCRTDRIGRALTIRRLQSSANSLGDHTFDALAQDATKSV
jgi:hypothetical protein